MRPCFCATPAVPISILFVLQVVLTGAYVFQEVGRTHKRIDAILKLLEEEAIKQQIEHR